MWVPVDVFASCTTGLWILGGWLIPKYPKYPKYQLVKNTPLWFSFYYLNYINFEVPKVPSTTPWLWEEGSGAGGGGPSMQWILVLDGSLESLRRELSFGV